MEEQTIVRIEIVATIKNGTMASAWQGGIGKYPQNPERLRQYLRPPEAKPTEEEVLPQPRRMRRVFSNTS